MTGPTPRAETPIPKQAPADVENSSVGQLMGNISRDLSTLVRQELTLARAEIKAEAGKASKGAGMLGGAGVAGYFVLLFVSLALWDVLAYWTNFGLGAVVVAVLWAVIGVVMFVVGRDRLRTVDPVPERTVETIKQVPDTLKNR